jgi:hypothetical protein
MFTSAECRAHAAEKLAAAEDNPQHRKRLLIAAEAWLHLADKIGIAERLLTTTSEKTPSKKRRKGPRLAVSSSGSMLPDKVDGAQD